jgi:histidinol dehydrogenase
MKNMMINPGKDQWAQLMERPVSADLDIEKLVVDIFEEIKSKGDVSVKKCTELFDGIKINTISVNQSEIQEAEKMIPEELKTAIQKAKSNIETFHSLQRIKKKEIETSPGVRCWLDRRPIEKVGIYIPGGTAPLFSTILMLAVPAKLAGCKEIVMCTPPRKDATVDPVMLYTAALCGVTTICKVGGIQAIAALTFGTAEVPEVYKIFGPGNQYVTYAKQVALRYRTAIDMPAGPSELLIYADTTAIPEFVAADLLSQAEHGTDSQVILISSSRKILDSVNMELRKQLHDLPRREMAELAIAHSKSILFEDTENAVDFINEYAPEHLIIVSDNEEELIQNINNAGSVFLGNYSPESAGDYASGTNHTLPTNGFAKQYSGVNLDSFSKQISFQKITKQGLKALGNTIELMAEAEGLQAHKNAISIRLNKIENEN